MRKMFHRKEDGFTLIELLVVIAILGVLAAVVVPNVSNFIGSADDEAMEAEVDSVRLAMTSLMVANTVSTVTAKTDAWTQDMTIVVANGDTLSNYLQETTTEYYYKWTASGDVTQDEDGT